MLANSEICQVAPDQSVKTEKKALLLLFAQDLDVRVCFGNYRTMEQAMLLAVRIGIDGEVEK
jgi:hypothetical protein